MQMGFSRVIILGFSSISLINQMISLAVVFFLFTAINITLFLVSSFGLSISFLSPHFSSYYNSRMKVRKGLDEVVVTPNRIKQGLGVVLIEKTLMTANHNLLSFNSNLAQGTGTSMVSLTSTHHVNSSQAIMPLAAPLFGLYYYLEGIYLPQKSDLAASIETQYKPFQKHVLSYQVKISESCFVWAAPTLQTRGNNLNLKQTFWRVPANSDILGNSARYLATRKIIRNSFKIISYHHDNGNVLNRT
jgi:hypothetical protein